VCYNNLVRADLIAEEETVDTIAVPAMLAKPDFRILARSEQDPSVA